MDPKSRLKYITHHVILLPDSPQTDDRTHLNDTALLQQCYAALRTFQPLRPVEEQKLWTSCKKMVTQMLGTREGSGDLSEKGVKLALETIEEGDVLAFDVRAQNAGLIIRKQHDLIIFESFELSPSTSSVMATKGRLRRIFPGPAIAIDRERLDDPLFCDMLAQILARLDVETPSEIVPTVFKAGSEVDEVRDTVHPKFVTEMLTGILRAIRETGDIHDPVRFQKRTRDDVLWDSTFKPWRRSPLWLLIRVALQSTLATSQGDHSKYKSFVAFFAAQILRDCVQLQFPSDTIHMINAKISRRVLKLNTINISLWRTEIESLVQKAHQEIGERWRTIEQNTDPLGHMQAWDPSSLNLKADTKLSLVKLQPYLNKISGRNDPVLGTRDFRPSCPRRLSDGLYFPQNQDFQQGTDYPARLSVLDIENWVEKRLDQYLSSNQTAQDSCNIFATLIASYVKASAAIYNDDPVGESLRLLTIMELWVAFDKLTILRLPLLGNYKKGFPKGLFEPLLLLRKSQLERIARIEEYLSIGEAAIHDSSLIFEKCNKADSFGVKFFQQSSHHQQLKRTIEDTATLARQAKMDEYHAKNKQHGDLMRQYNASVCDTATRLVDEEEELYHPRWCKRCIIKVEAESINIRLHEWPLPEKQVEAEAAVFELDVPVDFAEWREITHALLVDVFSPRKPVGPNNTTVYLLHQYEGLRNVFRRLKDRLHLASTSKSYMVAHYNSMHIAMATISNVCVNNGLHYELYDSRPREWTPKLHNKCDVREVCTAQFPPGPFQKLQYVMNSTTHTSNEVLARQSDCPPSLNLHEYYPFASLRSGHRLQWRNIAREVATRTLRFDQEETYLLVFQAACQAGRVGDSALYRDSHIDLEDMDFGVALITSLSEALDAIEGNWQNTVALRTFVVLAIRLLSMSPHTQIHHTCYLYLKRARKVALTWGRDLGKLCDDEQDEKVLKSLTLRALETGLLLHRTFDVDDEHVSAVINTDDDVADISECGIMVHDHCPANTLHLPHNMILLLRQFERTCHRLEKHTRSLIIKCSGGLDQTLRGVWSGYKAGTPWSCLQSPNDRWLVSQTSSGRNQSSVSVHFNLLDGSLLVNGLPLTRLPTTYEAHPTYQRLLGEKIFTVVISTMPGMAFETRSAFLGQQIHFNMKDSELIIRTQKGDQICELIPRHALDGDFAQALVEDYAHFLDIKSQRIEWRPLNNSWQPSSENWQMDLDAQGKYFLGHDTRSRLDVRSATAKSIFCLLSPIESSPHIHISFDYMTGSAEIGLPRMRLHFFLEKNGNALMSKQFRGMAIDTNQSCDTLTGLTNKLVLRHMRSGTRYVIVPYGRVSFAKHGNHVKVSISTGSESHVGYHIYQIDEQLGQLVDIQESLRSRLFKAYLHATTSHCLADKLTGCTGTEEALKILGGAAVRSLIELLQPEDMELLQQIAQLTPRRQYYPKYLRVMQQTEWKNLPPLSQHSRFFKHVTELFRLIKIRQLFDEHPSNLPELGSRGDPELLERAMIRESSFQVHDFGAESFSARYDTEYEARDRITDATRELNVCRISTLVDRWSQEPKVSTALLSKLETWSSQLQGSSFSNEGVLKLGFDLKWLAQPAAIFPNNWCRLHDILAQSDCSKDKYRVMMLLSTLAYSEQADQDLVHTLLAFATVPALRILLTPSFSQLTLYDGYEPVLRQVVTIAKLSSVSFSDSPDHKLPRLENENQNTYTNRRKQSYHGAMERCATLLAKDLVSQWPKLVTDPIRNGYGSYIRVNHALKTLRALFKSWYLNSKFQAHMRQNQSILDGITTNIPPLAIHRVQVPAINYSPPKTFVDFSDMTSRDAPNLPVHGKEPSNDWIESNVTTTADHDDLAQLLSQMSIETPSDTHEKEYLEGLSRSFSAMKESIQSRLRGSLNLKDPLISNVAAAKVSVAFIRQRLCDTLESPVCSISKLAGMLPRISPLSILQHLASEKIGALPPRWKAAFVKYGLAITALQRAQRLLATLGQEIELVSELQNNGGHQGFDPFLRPDWLLLELENDILIREEQAQIAESMMAPEHGKNTVMQLNMGLGKSSVIVPIIAAALADTTQLVRVIVLKPLAMQMFRLLVAKLGGLLQRRVVYLPVSRSLPLTVERARQIRELYEICMKERAILLLQPEHILSFELMGFEQLASGGEKLAIGTTMAGTQKWLYENSRDILDESDEILSVKFELIYTMGIQRAIDFSPERWVIIQRVLALLAEVAIQVKKQFPAGLEILTTTKGAVPRIRILETEACQKLLESLVQRICETGLPGVRVWNLAESTRQTLFKFLMNPKLVLSDWNFMKVSFSESMRNGVLLLRGLFAGGGLLRFTLEEKRWRVNFGLDLKRTSLAVPYHAKDTPSPRSEFSHPDTAIILTCLSYYYGTLSDQQVRASFEALLNIDHAKEVYALWVKDAPELPAQFRSLNGVNLSNSGEFIREVCPALRCARSVIDFYLSTIVFPAAMKEFPQKLSSSGWDLAVEKAHPTTGFSGTNDSKYVLPLSITQCDQPRQLATNASVLKCLLRAENNFLNDELKAPKDVLNANNILDTVVVLKQASRVILDVGAQVLELTNEEFAQAWLSKTPSSDAQAVIFFNSRDEICVLGRDGRQEPLASSPYSSQMDQCLIYLDESHTRGTDLKLPTNYRALVTLGPGLTKDRLVQACMRMRKLGKGQSVVFCGSLEIQRKILACCHRDSGLISVADVLKWCIVTTCSQTKKSIPLWATQGIRHQHRHAVIARSEDPVTQARLLLEDEAQTLQQRYGESSSDTRLSSEPKISDILHENRLQEIYTVCRQFRVTSFTDSTLQEEQERELSPENEREQQVELPALAKPLIHTLNPAVTHLVKFGVLVTSSGAFQPAFKSLSNTKCHQFFESGAWPEDLLVTADFSNTVKVSRGQQLDFFVRPVNWVITFKVDDELRCVVLSPFEAHELLPNIRKYKKVILHIYSPKTSVSISSFERLDFCPTPTILRGRFLPDSTTRQLNLFAGQLYFRSFDEYKDFCAFLGLCSAAPGLYVKVASDGFMVPTSWRNSDSKFMISPIAFIRSVMMMRRKGQSISSSHIGKILNGELILKEIFEVGDE